MKPLEVHTRGIPPYPGNQHDDRGDSDTAREPNKFASERRNARSHLRTLSHAMRSFGLPAQTSVFRLSAAPLEP